VASPATTPYRRQLAPSRLTPVQWGLTAAAAVAAAGDLCTRRNPLRGPALPLALAAGYVAERNAAEARPRLTYARGLVKQSSGVVATPEGGLWSVRLRAANSRDVRLEALTWFAVAGERRLECDDAVELQDLIASVTGGRDEREFLVVRYTAGSTIASGEPETLIELPLAFGRMFSSLGVRITYPALYGERHELTVETIPPKGLPPDP
jgi:hypothetical protein